MELARKKCVPCEGGIAPLGQAEAEAYLKQVDAGWSLAGGRIAREFRFRDFREAMSFVNKVAGIAEAEGHHPDIHIRWNRVRLEIFTHAINGLHENDFIVAAKIDALLE
ncbi:MAG: 4a-hydroxytetrahydrobiopterin dehydratase [Candidatus Micrarchaeota archaeon]